MTNEKIANNISELVGNTPLLKISDSDYDLNGELIVKLESFNPLSSVKDRIAVGMINKGESEGLINKDTVIIEPTSGNTGIGLAFIAASRNYRIILTMPDTISIEKRKLLAIFGAEIILTPESKGMPGAIEKSEELLNEIENSFSPRQFSNPINVETHYNTTAEEIWNDSGSKVDIIVCGVGTGGTITGIAKKLKEKDKNPNLKVVAVEPSSSPVLSGNTPGSHKIQGIGAGFIPDIYESDLIDEIIQVKDQDASRTMLSLAKNEGILVGISSGAATFAGIELAKKEENTGKRIIVILPDTGERYLSMEWVFEELYNEYKDVL